MSKKIFCAVALLASILTVGSMSHAQAASSDASDPVAEGNPEIAVSKIQNSLTASKTQDLHVGDRITWVATTVYENNGWGPVPPIPYRTNFVIRINRHHFPVPPVITGSNVPASCEDLAWTKYGNNWEYRCPVFWVTQGVTLSLSFTSVAGGDRLDQQWGNDLLQDQGSRGNRATVITGG